MRRSRPTKSRTQLLLAKLLKKESKTILIELWSDISGLNRTDFEALLDSLAEETPKQSRPKKGTTKKQTVDDRAAARIEKELRRTTGLDDALAVGRLSDALLKRGVKGTSIPPHSGTSLQAWIEVLITQVSETKVMAAARRLSS